MPILKSAAKRMRSSQKAREKNQAVTSQIKTVRSKLFEAVAAKNREAASKIYREYCSLLDKSAKKGIIKQNTAIRRKARAADKVRAL